MIRCLWYKPGDNEDEVYEGYEILEGLSTPNINKQRTDEEDDDSDQD